MWWLAISRAVPALNMISAVLCNLWLFPYHYKTKRVTAGKA